jgi:hypothetical protein
VDLSARLRLVTLLVAAHVVSSAFHFADNALRFSHYHDQATMWLNPTSVVVFWFVQTAFGLAGLILLRRGRRAGRPMLVAYGALGFAGFLHYLAPPSHPMGVEMHALILLEAATGLALMVAVLWPTPPPATPPTPPFAAFK